MNTKGAGASGAVYCTPSSYSVHTTAYEPRLLALFTEVKTEASSVFSCLPLTSA